MNSAEIILIFSRSGATNIATALSFIFSIQQAVVSIYTFFLKVLLIFSSDPGSEGLAQLLIIGILQ